MTPAAAAAGSIPPLQDDGQSPSSAGDTPSQHSVSDDDELEFDPVEALRQIVTCSKDAHGIINDVATMLASLDGPQCAIARDLLEKSLVKCITAMFEASWEQFSDDARNAVLRELQAENTGSASTSPVMMDSPSSPLSAQRARSLETTLSGRSGSTQLDEDGTLDAENDTSMMLPYSPSSEIVLSARSGSTQLEEDGTSDAENDPSIKLNYDGCVGGNNTDVKTSSAVTIQCAARRYLAKLGVIAAWKASGSDGDTGVGADDATVTDWNEAALNPYEVELAMKEEKIRALEEELRALKERLAAETGEVSIFPGLKRGCIKLGKKIERVSIATSSDEGIMTNLVGVVAFNPLDESGKPAISTKRRRETEATFIAVCALGISTSVFLTMKLTSDQAKLAIANANVIIDAVALKIDGFPLAFDNVDDLKERVAAKLLQKDLISNTKKRGKIVWETNADPQNAPAGALMMHRKMKDALKKFGFQFHKDDKGNDVETVYD